MRTLAVIVLILGFERSLEYKCQCMTQACSNYDTRYQADTLEDAIATFPDLSLGPDSQSSLDSDVGCLSKECQDCQKDLKKQLKKVGLLQPDIDDVFMTNPLNTTSSCKKYRFSMQKNMEAKNEKEDSEDSSSDEKEERAQRKRGKRQISTSSQNISEIIGTRYTLSCTTKGLDVDSTGTVSLCSSCWVWRKLPSNYKPQYVNELICDDTDGACLSGYATCSIGHRTFDAIRTEVTGKTTTVTLQAGSYCECRATSQSSIQSLVSGAGISGVYNPKLGN